MRRILGNKTTCVNAARLRDVRMFIWKLTECIFIFKSEELYSHSAGWYIIQWNSIVFFSVSTAQYDSRPWNIYDFDRWNISVGVVYKIYIHVGMEKFP